MTQRNSHTHCQAAQSPSSIQSLSESVSEPTHEQKNKKYNCPKMAIRYAGESDNMKVITLNRLTAKRKVKCPEIPHYA
jgi:hypothetical protein